jgi:PhnB protein
LNGAGVLGTAVSVGRRLSLRPGAELANITGPSRTRKGSRVKIEPYLFFNGCCEEALEFYRRVLGAEVLAVMRMKDSPEPQPPGMCPAGWEDKIMHAALRIGESQLMASDGMPGSQPEFRGFSLSMEAPDEATGRRWFTELGDSGQVQIPLAPTFFARLFGMVCDRFGVSWMVIVQPAGTAP